MSRESNFTRTYPPQKSSTKTSGVPLWWLIIAGPIEDIPQAKYGRKSSTVTF